MGRLAFADAGLSAGALIPGGGMPAAADWLDAGVTDL